MTEDKRIDKYRKGSAEISKLFGEMEISFTDGIKILAVTLNIAIDQAEELDIFDDSEEVRKNIADYITNKGSYDVSKL